MVKLHATRIVVATKTRKVAARGVPGGLGST
jgi:hypothetical protein